MGKDNKAQNTQSSITNEQLGILREQNQLQRENYERSQKLLQPTLDRYSRIIGGDRSAAFREVVPQIGQIDSGYQSAKDSIFDQIAPGAARDFALAGLERDRATTKSGFLNDVTMSAYDKLANLASGLGSFSLQELGAALRGGEGASQSNQALMQDQTNRKASQLGFFSSLAGAAGGMGASYLSPKR